MEKFWIVFRREYIERVKKKSFILITILSPLLMIAIIVVPMFMGMGLRDTSTKNVVVIDQTGKYLETIIEEGKDNSEGFVFSDGSGTIDHYRTNPNKDVYAVVLIHEDLLKNPRGITIFSHTSIPSRLQEELTQILKTELRSEKIASYDIPNLDKILDDTKVALNISTVLWSSDGEEKQSSTLIATIIGQVFNFTIFFFVTIYGSMVMNSITEEKKNRIVEIISSSVKPTTLLSAKITAIGALGLTQVIIWIVFLSIAFLALQGIFLSSMTFDLNQLQANIISTGDFSASDVQAIIKPLMSFNFTGIFIAFVFYFVCAYVSFASIFAALGAAVDSDEDVQQFVGPIMLLMVFGFYAALYSMNNPDGPLAFWGSFIPFLAPFVMMVRLPFDPPIWQLVLSSIIMVATTVFLVWAAAKIFRVGLLMYGKKPTPKEMMRWLKHS